MYSPKIPEVTPKSADILWCFSNAKPSEHARKERSPVNDKSSKSSNVSTFTDVSRPARHDDPKPVKDADTWLPVKDANAKSEKYTAARSPMITVPQEESNALIKSQNSIKIQIKGQLSSRNVTVRAIMQADAATMTDVDFLQGGDVETSSIVEQNRPKLMCFSKPKTNDMKIKTTHSKNKVGSSEGSEIICTHCHKAVKCYTVSKKDKRRRNICGCQSKNLVIFPVDFKFSPEGEPGNVYLEALENLIRDLKGKGLNSRDVLKEFDKQREDLRDLRNLILQYFSMSSPGSLAPMHSPHRSSSETNLPNRDTIGTVRSVKSQTSLKPDGCKYPSCKAAVSSDFTNEEVTNVFDFPKASNYDAKQKSRGIQTYYVENPKTKRPRSSKPRRQKCDLPSEIPTKQSVKEKPKKKRRFKDKDPSVKDWGSMGDTSYKKTSSPPKLKRRKKCCPCIIM